MTPSFFSLGARSALPCTASDCKWRFIRGEGLCIPRSVVGLMAPFSPERGRSGLWQPTRLSEAGEPFTEKRKYVLRIF